MWLSKPMYEALPYYYFVVGLIVLAAASYLDFWLWPLICVVVGMACLAAGVGVWWMRRSYRRQHHQHRGRLEQNRR